MSWPVPVSFGAMGADHEDMSDRPTTPPTGDPDPQRPEPVSPPRADQTAAVPQPPPAAPGRPEDTAQLPPQPAAAPPWSASGPPGAPAAAPPGPGWSTGAGPVAASAPAASAPPRGPRRWWGEATSTDGGRAALIAVAILGALLLVTGIGLVAALATYDGWDRDERVGMGNQWGPGMDRGQGNGQKRGHGYGPGMGNKDRGLVVPDDDDDLDDLGRGNGMGNGMGMGRGGLPGAGAVLHGEFTTNVTGTPTAMVFQTGQVTAYTAAKSLTVRSSDGFEATYALDAGVTTTGRGGTQLATGSQVYVLAAKEGMKVTQLAVVG